MPLDWMMALNWKMESRSVWEHLYRFAILLLLGLIAYRIPEWEGDVWVVNKPTVRLDSPIDVRVTR
jgi:hypothetical protein